MSNTKINAIATILGITLEPYAKGPMWVRKYNGLVRHLGSPPQVRLTAAVYKALLEMSEADANEPSPFMILPAGPRAVIYMEVETETLRQELREKEALHKAIADKDPRDAINMIMEQIRLLAMSLSAPKELVIEFQRLIVLSVAAYQWSIEWFATLQKTVEDAPTERKVFAFPVPPPNIPEPEPLSLSVVTPPAEVIDTMMEPLSPSVEALNREAQQNDQDRTEFPNNS